jgi:hypothetical protein
MQNNKRHLDWCLQQSKGIRIVASSDNLVKAYREKVKSALKSEFWAVLGTVGFNYGYLGGEELRKEVNAGKKLLKSEAAAV